MYLNLFTSKTDRHFMILLLAGLLISSCVTINVYFPAAAAEKAADRIIDQVLGEDGKSNIGSGSQAPAENKRSDTHHLNVSRFFVSILELISSDAHAAANIDISSPKIAQIKSSMQSRHGKLSSFYKAGAIGYSADGLVDIRDIKLVGLKDRGRLKQLVAQENQDRNDLYEAIAIANGHPEWEPQIRNTFARRWIAKSPRGWYHQNRNGQWVQK